MIFLKLDDESENGDKNEISTIELIQIEIEGEAEVETNEVSEVATNESTNKKTRSK